MESCILCLEINKDLVDSIKVNSTQWQELNITQLIKKYFWQLNSLHGSTSFKSWICLTCWQELDNFHKFYMRIEEAHINFGRLIPEDPSQLLDYKESLAIPKETIKEIDKHNFAYCGLEREELINQPPIEQDFEIESKSFTIKEEPQDELDDESLAQTCKLVPSANILTNKDPLDTKSKTPTKTKSAKKTKQTCPTETPSMDPCEEQPEVKLETYFSVDNKETSDTAHDSQDSDDSDSVRDTNYKPDTDNPETMDKAQKSNSKQRTNRKENDTFIATHFKQMFCDLCQVPFESFHEMRKHFAQIHKQSGYLICCKKKFFNRTRLINHIQSHLNPDHFKCKECGKIMSDRICLDRHMLWVHRPSEVVKKHFCDICGKAFIKACVLRAHKLTHLPEEEKKFPCSECGKSYASTYHLNQHTQTVHLRKFVKICYICGKSISSSADYKIHMNKHEGIPAPIINCDICGVRMSSQRCLKRHKETQHPVGGKQEHCCPICPKISPTLRALKKHINTMHEKGYDHKCTICEKAFKRAEALKEHMASHTGTALYTCPWCPKTFNSNGNMHAHRKKVHPKKWEEAQLQKYAVILPVMNNNKNITENS